MGQFADTFIVVNEIDTGAAILTGIISTVVDVSFAIDAGISRQTFTAVIIQMVVARATMLAGV